MSSELLPSLEVLDAMLARHPFGNSQYLTEQMHLRCMERLQSLSSDLPVADELARALFNASPDVRYRTLGDPVVRCAIAHACVQVQTGRSSALSWDQCKDVLSEASALVREGVAGGLGTTLNERIGSERYHGWIWDDGRPDDALGRAFRIVVEENYADMPCTPTDAERECLTRAAKLLEILLPESSRSVLSHTHVIAVFPPTGNWGLTRSSSEFSISGVIFLSQSVLNDPWVAAEHLFHEALHQQFYDFRSTHSLLNPDVPPGSRALIHSLWNMPDSRNGNQWDVFRAIAAYHVYTHLTLLSLSARQHAQGLEPEFGSSRMMVGSLTAAVRAHYLREQIRQRCWPELGKAGRRAVDWWSEVLDVLNPRPPALGACVHLLLERYWREATGVEALLHSKPSAREELRALLTDLARYELDVARGVVEAMHGDVRQFDDAVDAILSTPESRQDISDLFVDARQLVTRTILDMTSDDFQLDEARVQDEVVRSMVERSSAVLEPYLSSESSRVPSQRSDARPARARSK